MSFSKIGASSATGTRWRAPDVSPFSGMCSVCEDGCSGFCEVAKSAIRGRELLYPRPFGKITAASEKDYPVDFSHFNIMGSAAGAYGVDPDSDVAVFPAVNVEATIGNGAPIKLRAPFIFAAQGSTNVARDNWEGYAAGAALAGLLVVVGENVCGMDPNLELKNGKVARSPDLERRVKVFKDWYDGYGGIAVQTNVEDTRLGVAEYAIEKLGVEIIEIKWGQGAKDIGGEVKLSTIERAMQLKDRGYIVIPDPYNPDVQEAYRNGSIKEFERHSRVGMVNEEDFCKRVEELRKSGAKYVALKTGAYRQVDLARAVKYASEAKVDLLTVDGAGGGTGMSPWRMMNEWGIPTVYIESLLYQYLARLDAQGKFIPTVAIAGGFTLEDQIFKGLSIGAPYIKLVALGRAPMAAAMVGKTVAGLIAEGKAPKDYKIYGDSVEQVFIGYLKLKERFGKDVKRIPPAAVAVFTYIDRLICGLQQLMAGARKFELKYIQRDDVCALTREAAAVTGIPYVMDLDAEEVDKILA